MVFSYYLNWNIDWSQRHLLLPGKKNKKADTGCTVEKETCSTTLCQTCMGVGGSLGIRGCSNISQQIANKNKLLPWTRVHTNLLQLRPPPPPQKKKEEEKRKTEEEEGKKSKLYHTINEVIFLHMSYCATIVQLIRSQWNGPMDNSRQLPRS